MKAALDAELSIWASVGFTGVVVQQLLCVVKEPSDVNGSRTEAKHQAQEFSRALEQGGCRFGGGHTGCKIKSCMVMEDEKSRNIYKVGE